MEFRYAQRAFREERTEIIGPVASRRFRIGAFCAFAVLVAVRMPGVLHGRLWAEDGLFLLDALQQPWWGALTTPHTGYLNLAASLALLLAAHLPPLEYAPIASTAVALGFQICPAALILTTRLRWLQQPLWLAAALLLLATPPVSEEVWLNPITSQYHLMLCVGLILAIETRGGPIGAFRMALLAVAPLSGPGASFAIPLFVVRALRERSVERAVQAAVLCAGTLLQLWLIATHAVAERHLGIAPDLLLAVITLKHLVVPFLGRTEAFDVAGSWPLFWPDGGIRLQLCLAGGAALAAFAWAASRSRAEGVRWLAAAGLLGMVLSYFGALGAKEHLLEIEFGMRYAFAPQMLCALAGLGIAAAVGPGAASNRTTVLVARVAIGWLIVVGLHEFAWARPMMAHGPSWRAQVIEWRHDPTRAIVLWPPNFSIRLPVSLASGR